jgi:hypothetical protein
MNAPYESDPRTSDELKYDALIKVLRAKGELWTVNLLEDARNFIYVKPFLTEDEIMDSFGNPEDHEKQAGILVQAMVFVGIQ